MSDQFLVVVGFLDFSEVIWFSMVGWLFYVNQAILNYFIEMISMVLSVLRSGNDHWLEHRFETKPKPMLHVSA